MSIEKKSLINNMTATKKALIATTPSNPVVAGKTSVGLSKGFSKQGAAGFSKGLSKGFSKGLSKGLSKGFSKGFSKQT